MRINCLYVSAAVVLLTAVSVGSASTKATSAENGNEPDFLPLSQEHENILFGKTAFSESFCNKGRPLRETVTGAGKVELVAAGNDKMYICNKVYKVKDNNGSYYKGAAIKIVGERKDIQPGDCDAVGGDPIYVEIHSYKPRNKKAELVYCTLHE